MRFRAWPLILLLALAPACAAPELDKAVMREDTDAVRRMLADDAAANARDAAGRTALMGAARTGNIEIMRMLMAAGADVNAVDGRGWRVLDHAFEGSHFPAFRLLLEHRADPGPLLAAHNPAALPPNKARLYQLAAEHRIYAAILAAAGDPDPRLFDRYFSRFAGGYYAPRVSAALRAVIERDYERLEADGDPAALKRFLNKYQDLGQRYYIVTATTLNIRSSNNVSAPRAGEYNRGDQIEAIAVEPQWIQTDRGWVSREYLKQIRRNIPQIAPYLARVRERLDRIRPTRSTPAPPPPRRRPSPKAAPAAESKPDPLSQAGVELETILQRPTLPDLERFIVKYKDKSADYAPLLERARREYRSILLGE